VEINVLYSGIICNIENAMKKKLLRETDFTLSVIRDLQNRTKNEKSRD